MPTYQDTKRGYANLWNQASILPAHKSAAITIAKKIRSEPWATAFKQVEQATGVPDFLVGCWLERESSLDLETYLGNGEKLNKVTDLVPAGRGPWTGPNAFLNGAIDAIKHEGLFGIKDWYLPFMLYGSEKLNGFGYYGHNVNDPYVWSWTNLYSKGKYVGDGKWDANFVDPQPGVAAILKALAEVDSTVAARLVMDPSVTAAPGSSPTATLAPTAAPAQTATTAQPAGPATQSKPSPGSTPVTQETTMPTPTTTSVAAAPIPKIDFAMLEKFVESSAVVLPILGTFVPQAKVILPFIPILEQILLAADQIEKALAGGGDVWTILPDLLHKIADQMKAASSAPVAASTQGQSRGMPNAG